VTGAGRRPASAAREASGTTGVDDRFRRDRATLLADVLLGCFAYLQAALGPLVPLLRADLRVSYTVAGLHLSAFAAGSLAGGLAAERAVSAKGRRWTLWAGSLGMAAGALGLAAGRSPLVTVASCLVMGTTGGVVVVVVQSSLADRHGRWRAVALTEANVVASVGASLVPLCLGLGQASGLGWQVAISGMAAVLAATWLANRRVQLTEPASPARTGRDRGRLPGACRAWLVVLFLAVALEFSVGFTASAWLRERGLPTDLAVAAAATLYVPMLTGRVVGSRLVRTRQPERLLLGAFALAGTGVSILWLAPGVLPRLAGLALVGFGIANAFPLSLSAVLATVPGQADRASARSVVTGAVAVMVVPLLLGRAADRLGLAVALGTIPALAVVALVSTVVARRLADSRTGGG
jgi:fucose permease